MNENVTLLKWKKLRELMPRQLLIGKNTAGFQHKGTLFTERMNTTVVQYNPSRQFQAIFNPVNQTYIIKGPVLAGKELSKDFFLHKHSAYGKQSSLMKGG